MDWKTTYLETTLRKELFRSESFAAFMAWMSSNDRAAIDFRETVEKHELREQARAIVRRYRGHYENNQARFELDREKVPV